MSKGNKFELNKVFLKDAVDIFSKLDINKSKARFYLNGNPIVLDEIESPKNSNDIKYHFKLIHKSKT